MMTTKVDRNDNRIDAVVTTAGRGVWLAVVAGVMLLGRPGYGAWGSVAAGLTVLLGFYLLRSVARRESRIEGNWIHAALWGLTVLLAFPMLLDTLREKPTLPLGGELQISMVFHLGLLSLGIMVTQGLAPTGVRHGRWIFAAGVIVILGALCNVWQVSHDAAVISSLRWSLLGGCGMFLCVAGIRLRRHTPEGTSPRGLGFSRRAAVGFVAAGLAAATGLWWWLGQDVPLTVFGFGEAGFAWAFAGGESLGILVATTGVLGGLWFVGWCLALWVQALRAGRIESLAWVAARVCATAALLSPGGWVNPAVGMGFVVAWGLGPGATGAAGRVRSARISGWWFLGGLLMIFGMLGLCKHPGLIDQIGKVAGVSDKGLHGIFGFLVSLSLAWVLSSKRWWLGLIGWGGGVFLGALAEGAQSVLTAWRNAEWMDWELHAVGCLIALLLFLLGLMWRGEARRDGRWEAKPPLRRAIQIFSGVGVLLLLVAVGVGWLATTARHAAKVMRQGPATVTLTDSMILADGKTRYLPGLTNQRGATYGTSMLSAYPGESRLQRGWQSHTKDQWRVYLAVSTRQRGVCPVRGFGMPFGPLSYVQRHPCVSAVSPEQTVMVIDAPAALGWLQTNRDALTALVTGPRPAVFLHPGPAKAYLADRAILAKAFPAAPCLYELRRPPKTHWTTVLLRRSLAGRKKVAPPSMIFVTNEPGSLRIMRRHFRGGLRGYFVGVEADLPNRAKKWVTAYSDLPACVASDAARTEKPLKPVPSP